MTFPNLAPIPELYVSYESAQKMKLEAADLVSHDLSPRQICDLELLMNGGFNPLKGFLSEADYDNVVENMRLADGTLWPMPITLDVSEDFADKLELGQDIALRDQEGVILGTMTVTDRWTPDKSREAEKVFGTAHIAFGSIRMEPVFMILGQSAGTAAALAIDEGVAVQDVPYEKLKARLLKDGQRLQIPETSIGGISAKTMSTRSRVKGDRR